MNITIEHEPGDISGGIADKVHEAIRSVVGAYAHVNVAVVPPKTVPSPSFGGRKIALSDARAMEERCNEAASELNKALYTAHFGGLTVSVSIDDTDYDDLAIVRTVSVSANVAPSKVDEAI